MFDPRLETVSQMTALHELIMKLVKKPADAKALETLLAQRDILKIDETASFLTPHDWIPAAWCCGQRLRPQILIWAWFYPQHFKILVQYKHALKRVNSWYELNPWHFELSAKHGLPLIVMAKLRTVVNNLRAEKEADYQRRKAERINAKRNLLATDSDEDFDFID
jgi:hypothetical protein